MEEKDNQEEEKKASSSNEKLEETATNEEIKKVPSTIWKYIISIFSFSNDKDVNVLEVTENIKKDIEFKGYNVWVLMCSIVIASIGLNVNSIAVVIGAMLISPLMGPIRGIGLSVGTNNFKLLIYSLMNFGVATVVSVLVSFIYFKIMPFKDETTEILARTEPLILDVLVAFFGGLAGIIAASRNDNSTVVPGVAIATALMPPLCVTGYGLATGNWNYTLGAFYLFILNSLFICLATIVVVRYLRFPLATYINKKRERNIKIYIALFLIIILVPSGVKFMEVFNKSVFTNSAQSFIREEIKSRNDVTVTNEKIDYSNKTITIFLGINDYIPEREQEQLVSDLKSERFSLDDCKLVIEQNEDLDNGFTVDDYRLLMNDWKEKILEKNLLIERLKKEANSRSSFSYNSKEVEQKLKFEKEFDQLASFSASNAYKLNMDGTCDTNLLFVVNWNDTLLNQNRTQRLNDWIKLNFDCKNFDIIEKTK